MYMASLVTPAPSFISRRGRDYRNSKLRVRETNNRREQETRETAGQERTRPRRQERYSWSD